MRTRNIAIVVVTAAIAFIVAAVVILKPSARTDQAAPPETFFGNSVPAQASDTDAVAVELGMRFQARASGVVTAIRFYKGPGNGGTHVGTIWDVYGHRLASVTFTGETDSGWQQAALSPPLRLRKSSNYVVSYLAPQGHYASTPSYFLSAHATTSLYAWPDRNGRNGVYRYGGGFPTLSYNASNYYVDVMFVAGVTSTTTAPVSTSTSTTTTVAPTSTAAPTGTTTPGTTTVAPTTTAPPASGCTTGGTFLWSNLEACGWPGPANTGYPAGTQLKAGTGRTITAAGTVVDGEQIDGSLTINAPNVTIRNSLINYSGAGGGGSGAIKILAGASATIDHVEVNGNSAVHACIWHEGATMTVTAVHCHGSEDGIFSWAATGTDGSGDNFTIADSYLRSFTAVEANGHVDGYQTEGSANGVIRHNTFDVPATGNGGVSLWNDQKNTDNIVVDNNLLGGGGFTVYAEDYSPTESNPVGGYTMTNVRFTNNKFSNHYSPCVGSFGVWFYRGSTSWPYHGGPTGDWGANGNIRSGNVILETKSNVDAGNPAGCS